MTVQEHYRAGILRTALPLVLATSILPALSGCAVESDEGVTESGQAVVCTPISFSSGEGRVMAVDYAGGAAPGSVQHLERWGDSPLLNGWMDSNDRQLAGDFMGLGHDQVMYVNRGGDGGKVMIVDLPACDVGGQAPYWESWGDSPVLNGWLDDGDLQLVGDFMGLGHSQAMYFNRQPGGGRVMIMDYAGGSAPGAARYWESWGDSPLLNGWTDDGDRQLVGDFMGLGHSQVMYFNRQPGGGRVMIVDYASGSAPGSVRYWESWGDSLLLDGWTDDGDRQLVGDFMGLGHSQVMYFNRQPGGGRVMIVDYASGSAEARYWESWGDSPLLDGWTDDTDRQLVGDFMGLGHAQVMYVNRDVGGGKVMVVDYAGGAVPGQVRFWESWGDGPLLDGWLDEADTALVGDFTGVGHAEVLRYNRDGSPAPTVYEKPPQTPYEKYAPMVWLHSGESYQPSSVEDFLPNVHDEVVSGEHYYVTNQALGCDSCTDPAFLDGRSPSSASPVPVYVEVVNRTQNGQPTNVTDAIYWMFYPYNAGKRVCIGEFFDNYCPLYCTWPFSGSCCVPRIDGCVGDYSTFGNHVGDWEHVTIRFVDGVPTEVALSQHDGGQVFSYGDPRLELWYGRPVVYAAKGSHGLYPDAARHTYKSLPNGDTLNDDTDAGTLWDARNALIEFSPQATPQTGSLSWLNYSGRWGNPESGCTFSSLVSDECVLNPGPGSILPRSVSSPELRPVE
jgi:hypothetical protein